MQLIQPLVIFTPCWQIMSSRVCESLSSIISEEKTACLNAMATMATTASFSFTSVCPSFLRLLEERGTCFGAKGRIVRVIGPIWVSLALYSDNHKFVSATVAGVAVTMRIQQHKARLCSKLPRVLSYKCFPNEAFKGGAGTDHDVTIVMTFIDSPFFLTQIFKHSLGCCFSSIKCMSASCSPECVQRSKERTLAPSSLCLAGAKCHWHRMLHSDYSLLTGFQEVPELPTRDQFEQVAWVCLSEGGGRGWAGLFMGWFCLQRQALRRI